MQVCVLPTQACHLKTKVQLLMVLMVCAGEPVADLAWDRRRGRVWWGGLLRHQPKPYIIEMQWFLFFLNSLCCVPPLLITLCSIFNLFLTTVTFDPITKHLAHASIASIMYLYIYWFVLVILAMLSIKVSSIVQETMPATRLTKCCHVDLNCLQERKWFMQVCLFFCIC